MTTKIAVIGCGNIGLSLVKGWLKTDTVAAENIYATRRNTSALSDLKSVGVCITADNKEAIAASQYIVLAVKPHRVAALMEEIAAYLKADQHILLSVATGVSCEELLKMATVQIPVYRVMPNTGAHTAESMTCIAELGSTEVDHAEVDRLFSALGTSLFIHEELMEAATILGACGIAFVFRFMRAMVQAGVQIGFDTNTASTIVNQTVKGAAELLMKNGTHPEEEIDKVTTPKGCTIVGLNEMEHQGFSSSLIHGIVHSFEKIERK